MAIKYVGHPFVDVGVSVMEIILGKQCEDFTEDDIKKANDELIKRYDKPILKSYLSTIFPNSCWANYNIGKEKKEANIQKLLYPNEILKEKCFYCENKANTFANRQDIPLLSGEGVINVISSGKGLPVCRYCLSSIQFFPLATMNISGKALLWHTNNRKLDFMFAKNYFNQLDKIIYGSPNEKIKSFSHIYTRLIDSFINAFDEVYKFQNKKNINYPLTDCIAYHFTNRGQNPKYNEYIIPYSFIIFIEKIKLNSNLEQIYNKMIHSKWDLKKDKDAQNIRNSFYDSLARYFQDEESKNELILHFKNFDNKELNSFDLTKLFIVEIFNINENRLKKVKEIADTIVKYASEELINNFINIRCDYKGFFKYIRELSKELEMKKINTIALDDLCYILNLLNSDSNINSDYWIIRCLIEIRILETR
ncbi:MAG: hypothetical protein U0457_08375 [Candidatus Sericytochromatia bacterium]